MLYFPLIPCTGNEKNKDNSQFTFAKEKEIMKCECKKSFKPQKIWFDLNILKKCICQLIFFPYEYSPEKERAFKIFSYCFLKPLEPKLLAIFNNFIIITYFLVRLKDVSKCTILDTSLSLPKALY